MKNIVDAIIEIPMGTKNKYEIDKATGKIRLSRVLYSSMTYPAEYGCIADTLEHDGDPIDILVLTSEATFPGCVVEAKIIGYLETIDSGFQDTKLIAVNNVDPRYNYHEDLNDLPAHTLLEIKNFFSTYKLLQKIKVEVKEFHSQEEAIERLEQAIIRYQEQKKGI